MGLTYVQIDQDCGARFRQQMVDITFDSSYPTGGETVSASAIGLGTIYGLSLIATDTEAAGYVIQYNYVTNKLMAFTSAGFTPAGTVGAPVFTGDALTAHRHVLHFQTSAAANAVTAASNALRTAAAAFDVAGVANSSGEGGVVDVTGGTPTGTNSAPLFAGTPVAAGALAQVANATNLSTLTVRAVVWGV